MGKVSKYIYSKEIDPMCGEGEGKMMLELSHDGYHLHFRNLRIRIKQDEMPMWKKAFSFAKPRVERQNLLGD